MRAGQRRAPARRADQWHRGDRRATTARTRSVRSDQRFRRRFRESSRRPVPRAPRCSPSAASAATSATTPTRLTRPTQWPSLRAAHRLYRQRAGRGEHAANAPGRSTGAGARAAATSARNGSNRPGSDGGPACAAARRGAQGVGVGRGAAGARCVRRARRTSATAVCRQPAKRAAFARRGGFVVEAFAPRCKYADRRRALRCTSRWRSVADAEVRGAARRRVPISSGRRRRRRWRGCFPRANRAPRSATPSMARRLDEHEQRHANLREQAIDGLRRSARNSTRVARIAAEQRRRRVSVIVTPAVASPTASQHLSCCKPSTPDAKNAGIRDARCWRCRSTASLRQPSRDLRGRRCPALGAMKPRTDGSDSPARRRSA